MGEPDATARRRSVAIAGHAGDVETALAHLHDPEPVVRATALRALLRLGALDGPHLSSAVADASPVVRRAAAGVLAARPQGIGVDRLEAELASLLADADATVSESAAWAAGEQHRLSAARVSQLADLATGHHDALVREAAVAALGSLGDPAGREAVLAATEDKATVRRRAVLALAAFDGPEVEAALERACTDRDRQVRQAAEDLRYEDG